MEYIMETGNALPKLNDSLLERYIHNFYGYGNLESGFWFISLEEAGLDSPDREEQFRQIQRRIDLWEKRGYRKLEDCRSFYQALSVSKSNEWFSKDPKIQQTWKMYIRILFNFEENKEFIEGDKKQQIKQIQ
ncbi:MAG: hypothetical protein CMP46_00550, partial [Rickettsiales bacterium]|nr:hypothetical protein [Rickettsiales bacterium]